MKNNIRYVFYTILLFVFSIYNVNAFNDTSYNPIGIETGSILARYVDGSTMGTNLILKGYSDNAFKQWRYYTTAEGKEIAVYCLDPGASFQTNGMLFFTEIDEDNSDARRVMEAGLIAIYQYGYGGSKSSNFIASDKMNTQINENPLEGHEIIDESDDASTYYMATSIALRSFYIGVFNQGRTTDSDELKESFKKISSAHGNFAIDTLEIMSEEQSDSQGFQYSDLTYEQAINALSEYVPNVSNDSSVSIYDRIENSIKARDWYSSDVDFGWLNEEGNYDASYTTYKHVTLELLKIGIAAAAEEAMNIEKEKNGTGSITYSSNANTITEEGTKYSVQNIKLVPNDFSGEEKLDQFNFSLTNNSGQTTRLTYTIEYMNGTEDKNYTDYQYTEVINDIKGKLNSTTLKDIKSISIELKVEISDDSCGELSYKLEYNNFDSTLYEDSFFLKQNLDSSQLFIGAIPYEGDPEPVIVNKEIDTCPDLCETEITIPNQCVNPVDQQDEGWNNSYQVNEYEVHDSNNILQCIIGSADEADNNYQLTCDPIENASVNTGKSIVENPYCSVSCKEDYRMLFPGVRDINSGRYFTIDVEIEGNKSCYTSEIQEEQFISDVKRLQETIIEEYNGYIQDKTIYDNANVSNCGREVYVPRSYSPSTAADKYVISYDYADRYNLSLSLISETGVVNEGAVYGDNQCGKDLSEYKSEYKSGYTDHKNNLETAQTALNKAIEQYKACSSWTEYIEYILNPELTYNVEDSEYVNNSPDARDKDGDIIMNSTSQEQEATKTLSTCRGDVNNEYNTCNSGDMSSEIEMSSVNFLECDVETGCKIKTESITMESYISTNQHDQAEYTTPRTYHSLVSSGNIVYEPDIETNDEVIVVDGIPVEVKPTEPIYTFNIFVDGLGDYYDDESCENSTLDTGRLVDKDKEKDSVEDVLIEDGLSSFTGEYVCYAPINCPECDISIDGGFPDDPYCPTCKFDISINILYRTYSSDAFNPNDRPLGSNWNYEDKTNGGYTNPGTYDYNVQTKYGFVTLKAQETLGVDKNGEIIDNKGILGVGNEIYAEEPFLSVTLDSSLANDIKDFYDSDDIKKAGGYSYNSLTCQSVAANNITYENLLCYSEALDEWISSNSDNFEFSVTRPDSDAKITLENSGDGIYSDKSGYWTLFTEGIQTPSETTIGGPAWR